MSTSSKWAHLYEGHAKAVDESFTAHVIRGFGRGSKELGFPTANLDMEELGERGNMLGAGIYYGRATLHNVEYQTVVSVGWNPFYKNEKKTVEAHILHKFDDDFYGEVMMLRLVGYLRPEANFTSLEDLISCINSDIDVAKERLLTT